MPIRAVAASEAVVEGPQVNHGWLSSEATNTEDDGKTGSETNGISSNF